MKFYEVILCRQSLGTISHIVKLSITGAEICPAKNRIPILLLVTLNRASGNERLTDEEVSTN